MRKCYFILILSLVLISCSNHRTTFEQLLLANKWFYYPTENVSKNVKFLTYLKFNENQTCENRYVSSNEAFSSVEDSDGPGMWVFNKKTNTLTIFEREFLILSFSKDTIVMKERQNDFKSILIRYRK